MELPPVLAIRVQQFNPAPHEDRDNIPAPLQPVEDAPNQLHEPAILPDQDHWPLVVLARPFMAIMRDQRAALDGMRNQLFDGNLFICLSVMVLGTLCPLALIAYGASLMFPKLPFLALFHMLVTVIFTLRDIIRGPAGLRNETGLEGTASEWLWRVRVMISVGSLWFFLNLYLRS